MDIGSTPAPFHPHLATAKSQPQPALSLPSLNFDLKGRGVRAVRSKPTGGRVLAGIGQSSNPAWRNKAVLRRIHSLPGNSHTILPCRTYRRRRSCRPHIGQPGRYLPTRTMCHWRRWRYTHPLFHCTIRSNRRRRPHSGRDCPYERRLLCCCTNPFHCKTRCHCKRCLPS